MDRAGIETARELLSRAGMLGEHHAEETLLRVMYGPPVAVGPGYLEELDAALEICDDDERRVLAYALMFERHVSEGGEQ